MEWNVQNFNELSRICSNDHLPIMYVPKLTCAQQLLLRDKLHRHWYIIKKSTICIVPTPLVILKLLSYIYMLKYHILTRNCVRVYVHVLQSDNYLSKLWDTQWTTTTFKYKLLQIYTGEASVVYHRSCIISSPSLSCQSLLWVFCPDSYINVALWIVTRRAHMPVYMGVADVQTKRMNRIPCALSRFRILCPYLI